MNSKDLLSITDLNEENIRLLLSDAVDLRTKGWLNILSGKTLAIMFEKPSLRTRVSFELAMRQLGGQTIYLSPAEVGLGQREPVADVARVLSRYVDAMAVRTFAHRSLEVLANYADVPVINALSDWEHPCQALADLLTIYEKKGEFQGLIVAYIGDGNNCARSLMLAASMVGINFRIASPAGYTIDEKSIKLAKSHALSSGGGVFCTEEPALAASGADVVYTDAWTSMGQEAEKEERRLAFKGYQVNAELLASTNDGAIFMHPLPAHQGEEVAEGILDDPRSVVFDQAENRLHVQKALLAQMLGGLDISLPRYR